jgi:hypothetical protein
MAPKFYVAKNNMRRKGAYRRPYSGAYYGQRVPIRGMGGFWGDTWAGAKRLARSGYSYAKKNTPAGTFKKIGTGVGGFIGSQVGQKVKGANVGGALGQAVAELAGFGAYNVRSNTLLPGKKLGEGTPVPVFGDIKNASVIAHREFIGNVIVPAVPGNFNVTSYPINPGISGSFPWMSSIALNYDQYQILGMVFEYRTTSSNVSTSSALGSVIMATEYDVSQVPYNSKLEMSNSQYSMSAAPTQTMLHPIECDPQLHPNALLNIRYSSTTFDKRWYDWATFQIATEGLTGLHGEVIGELYVTYQIALYKPSLPASQYISKAAVFKIDAASIPTTDYFGDPLTRVGSTANTLNCTFPDDQTLKIEGSDVVGGTFYEFYYFVVGSSTTLTSQVGVSVTNATNSTLVYDGLVDTLLQTSGTVSARQLFRKTFVSISTGVPITFNIGVGTTPNSPTAAFVGVRQVSQF